MDSSVLIYKNFPCPKAIGMGIILEIAKVPLFTSGREITYPSTSLWIYIDTHHKLYTTSESSLCSTGKEWSHVEEMKGCFLLKHLVVG
jgi:hypothetical protein